VGASVETIAGFRERSITLDACGKATIGPGSARVKSLWIARAAADFPRIRVVVSTPPHG
jgi:hypothetical protein